jgi:hypothetical protein
MLKKVFSFILVVISLVVLILPHTTHGYEWHLTEKLNTETQRYSMGFCCSGAGEKVYIIPLEVYTDFFTRCEVSHNEIKFTVKYFEISSNQKFEDVSGTFSQGSCNLAASLTDVKTCLKLETEGNVQRKFVEVTLKGPKGEVLYMVFGPPTMKGN